MAERGLAVDHVTIWRWVQRYGPILNQRLRRERRQANRSWRVDETYVRVGGAWVYLYRAVDSTGDTIDFMLSPNRDLVAAKHFLQLALHHTGRARPRVINVDGHPAYGAAISQLKRSGELGRRCRCRPSPYMNNVLEQDHRFIKKRIAASLWFRSIGGALNTIAGYESMHMIPKRSNPLASKGRYCWPEQVHPPSLRHRCMNPAHRASPLSILSAICNTSVRDAHIALPGDSFRRDDQYPPPRRIHDLYGLVDLASAARVAAALAKAVFDATGTRLRSVPFTPDRVKAALTNAQGVRRRVNNPLMSVGSAAFLHGKKSPFRADAHLFSIG